MPKQCLFVTPKDGQLNSGIFGDGWVATYDQDQFLKYLAPIYRRATKEQAVEKFFTLLYPVWFDCFPVILRDGMDHLDPGSVDPDRVEWAKRLQKNYLLWKMYWVGWWSGKPYKNNPAYDKWEQLLTLMADHERRCAEWFYWAKYGVYQKGHQYDIVITPGEKDALEKTLEEAFQEQVSIIEANHFAYMKFLEMPDQ